MLASTDSALVPCIFVGFACPPFGVTRPPFFFFVATGQSVERQSSIGFTKRAKTGQARDMARVLVIDSYDSFVYNIVQYLGELGAEPVVVRNDQLTVEEAVALNPDGVLLSPGPGRPEEAGIICDAIRAFAGNTPVFGVCLGHQAIGHVYGGDVVRAPQLMHGKTSFITHTNTGVFTGIPSPVEATRYHSLVIDRDSMPKELIITAETSDGIVMGVKHRDVDVEGVQFHPESILTGHGHDMLRNFLQRCEK